MKTLTLLFSCLAGALSPLIAADKPNILWITSEDNGSEWLGCYGNPDARTPRIDQLAQSGLRFTHVYSNGPVCAVARSTILNGAYAPTQGTQHMRSRYPIPSEFVSYVKYLRDAGYYCTNHSKTDYNFAGNDTAIWDECSESAHYNHRPEGKPFFAIFNLMVSHESSLFSSKIASNRKSGIIPTTPRLDPAKVFLPPYLPDLPEIRSDIAIYHDTMTALDQQVASLLDELKASGQADNTIVFYYSDHAGILPRGKRYLEDTGVRVPLIVHLPEKWAHLSPFKPGSTPDELVAFIDLAPTLLSLIGMDKPSQMQGRAFLGEKRTEPTKDPVAFLYADRFDEIYGMRRGLTDGRWKYIRCFTPHLPGAPYSAYQFGQAGWTAWQKAWKSGKLSAPFNELWEAPQPVERLFDTENDRWEIHNLASDPAQNARLTAMRERLKSTMTDAIDTGIIPEPMFHDLSPDQPVANYLASRKAELPALVDFTFTASAARPENLPALQAKLTHPDPLTRYWAAAGCLILGKHAAPAANALTKLLDDSHSAIRVAAAHELYLLGRPEGKAALFKELDRAKGSSQLMNLVNTLNQLNALGEIPASWITETLANPNADEYAARFAKSLKRRNSSQKGKPIGAKESTD